MNRIEAARAAVAAGDWPAAEALCGQLVEDPELVYEGLDLSAAVALGRGLPRRALELAEKALELSPGDPRGYLRRGAARLALGEPQFAEADFVRAVELDPSRPAAHQALGLTRLDLADAASAEPAFDRALDLETGPAAAISFFGRGLARRRLGRFAEARADLEAALRLDDTHAPSRLELAALAESAGDRDEAEALLRLELDGPMGCAARSALVALLDRTGRQAEALATVLSWPRSPASERPPPCRRALMRLSADRRLSISRLGEALRDRLSRALTDALEAPDVDPQDAMATVIALVKLDPRCESFLGLLESGGPAGRRAVGVADGVADGGAVEPWGPTVRLLLYAMTRALVTDLDFEKRLLRVRRSLLSATWAGGAPWLEGSAGLAGARWLDGAAALAGQAFLGRYLHPLDEAERRGAARWRRRLERALGQLHPDADRTRATETACCAALVALAEPLGPHLSGLGAAHRARLVAVAPPIGRLLEQQVDEPAIERRLAETMRRQPLRENRSSAAVRRHYESFPYPRWSGARLAPRPESPASILRRLFGPLPLPDYLRRPGSILVAGCGTGQQAVAAAHRYQHDSILAVDLSAESLAYAERMSRRFGDATAALRFRRADVLELRSDDGPFDVVLCTGVLHHLADPEAGWRHLTTLLRPGGVLKVALYSQAARRGLETARRELSPGARASADEVRAARRRLAAGPHRAELARFIDFFSLVGCRDLLFHVREQSYTLRQIGAMIERLGLRFHGFELPRDETRELYDALYPLDPTRVDLDNWAALESAWPATFADMYQFWCQVPATRGSGSQPATQ
jgi:2-polyprenyl-3-methyl-5-hydroxy-6-metoxy-1,4-benzoquinol methylase/Tfp pilus assembly protein PilF